MQIHQDPVPLRIDESGQVRVGPTRMIFKLLIEAYLEGASPEDISETIYPGVALADVYGAITYYLRHQDEVHQYMREWDETGAKLQREIEEKQPPKAELKAKLLKRKAEMEMNGTWGVQHAPAAQ